jgi:hypothetical protein
MFNLLYKISHNFNNAVQLSRKISKNYLILQYNQKRIIETEYIHIYISSMNFKRS